MTESITLHKLVLGALIIVALSIGSHEQTPNLPFSYIVGPLSISEGSVFPDNLFGMQYTLSR